MYGGAGNDTYIVDDDYDAAVEASIARVSTANNGTQGNAPSYSPLISADGRYVAFGSDASNLLPADTNNGSISS